MMGLILACALVTAAPTGPKEPRLSARVAVVMDLDTGEVLFRKGTTSRHAIASISKLMAMRVVLRRGLPLDGHTEMVKSDWKYTAGGARTRLIRGRKYSNRDLLHAALLGSDNRAVVALGRAVGLEAPAFARAMTAEARALGLKHTHFVDPTGIDHGNVSTADEVVELLKATLAMPALARVTRTDTWKTEARERSRRPLVYHNTNRLVFDERRPVLTGKTGFNSAAGWCVASALKLPSGRRLAVVVLGARTKHLRFGDARKLIRWAEGLPWSPSAAESTPTRSAPSP